MGAVGDHAVEERLALDALAHQPALHVRDGDDDRVDLAVADHLLELEEARMLRAWRRPWSWSLMVGLASHLIDLRDSCRDRPLTDWDSRRAPEYARVRPGVRAAHATPS